MSKKLILHLCADRIECDGDFRSLCSTGFAKAFKEVNN